MLGWCQQTKRLEGLPSWVPDFSSGLPSSNGINSTFQSRYRIYGDAGFVPPSLRSTSNPNVLGLTGVKLAVVREISSRVPESCSGFSLVSTWQELRQFIYEVEIYCKRSPLFVGSEGVEDARMRIPCADLQRGINGGREKRAHQKIHLLYDKINLLGETEDGGDDTYAYIQDCRDEGRKRRPFLADVGHVGLAPASAQPGDYICILFGCHVPIVLRPSSEGCFVLVGEAYVYGIMDGEWFHEERPSETFFIR